MIDIIEEKVIQFSYSFQGIINIEVVICQMPGETLTTIGIIKESENILIKRIYFYNLQAALPQLLHLNLLIT
jgi:hypothetical protein